jgi:VWFA-related protein
MHLFSAVPDPRTGLPVALLVLSALWAGLAVGQEEPAGRVEAALEVREVLLDVLVTDPQGHVIVGLGAEDFVVEEDGRPVAVESVSFYSNRRLLGPAAPAGDGVVPEDRTFIFLFVRPATGPARDPLLMARLPRAGGRCAEWVRRHLLPSDHVAVAVFDGALNPVRDFTVDPAEVEEALRRAATGSAPRQHWSTRIAPASGPSIAALFGDDGLRQRTASLAEAIAELARSLRGVPGRKVLILLGADFPPPLGWVERRDREAMVEALNGSNVAVYPLDVTGRGRRPGLEGLARATGGGYPFHGRDLVETLREIERENSGFYLLSYKSTQPPGEVGYRRVEVRTTNPELEARARSGYGAGG